jgi:hypothetical protein
MNCAGCKSGVTEKLNAKVGQKIPNFQCEVSCCKVLKINVLKWVLQITNFIRDRGFNHQQFASLFCDLERDYEDLPCYT